MSARAPAPIHFAEAMGSIGSMRARARDRAFSLSDPLPGIVAIQYDTCLDRAQQAEANGLLGEALGQFELAARIAPRRALPWDGIGSVLLRLGRGDEAVLAFDEALARDPSDATAAEGRTTAMANATPAFVTGPRTAVAGAPRRAWVRRPERRRFARYPAPRRSVLISIIFIPYVIGLAVAELAVTFVSPVLVFPLHGGLSAVAIAQLLVVSRWRDRDRQSTAAVPVLLTLVLAPLIRLISLTLPLTQIAPPYRYLFAGVPMALGAVLTAMALGYRPRQIGLVWRGTGWQVFAIVASVGLGFAEYAILRPAPLGPPPWVTGSLLPALSVGLATGLPEELIFRGLMQTAARPLMGRWNVLFVSLVFAILHIGYANALDLGFVFTVGLAYGWLFERTRSIIGISIGHGMANVVLFFVAPYVLG